ncbi:hypothetical protein SAMN04487948_10161 [Halogranum amylolyticum]|uniref:Uncharacterized protein n=1 Tax=Halogranum amylolyticum TaxID=660520 RepID=A0A1H8MSS5_9EURY|nr:hypothetical protein SAMN04487948_10161 [Halogranum amylolyticum]
MTPKRTAIAAVSLAFLLTVSLFAHFEASATQVAAVLGVLVSVIAATAVLVVYFRRQNHLFRPNAR